LKNPFLVIGLLYGTAGILSLSIICFIIQGVLYPEYAYINTQEAYNAIKSKIHNLNQKLK